MGCTDQEVNVGRINLGPSEKRDKEKARRDNLTPAQWNKITKQLLKLLKIVEQATSRECFLSPRSAVKEGYLKIANRENAFQLGAIGQKELFDIIVSSSKIPDYYAKDKQLRRRDCQINARQLYKALVSKLDPQAQWTLFRLLSDKFQNDKRLRLAAALKSK